MQFFGREQEYAELTNALAGNKFESMLIYGRRRVGKTELIRHALNSLKDGLVISCECKRTNPDANLKHISSTVAPVLGFPSDYQFASFDLLFEAVFSAAEKQKIVLSIDEFSFLLKEEPSIDSSIAIAIDKYRHTASLKLILSGSYVDLMLGLIDAESPLYGRFTHIIGLQPFDYFTSALFYPNYSPSDKLFMYAAFGGMPYFNSLIDSTKSAKDNIIELIVRKDSILEHEINEMLLNETNKITGLNTVIELVGEGVSKYSDLVARLSQDKSTRPAYALSKLQDMSILRKVEPINAKGNRKRTFYAFGDNLVHFYYRYVFRYLAERNTMTPKDFFEEFVAQDLATTYLPMKFEELCAEAIARLSRKGHIKPPVHEVGTYSFDDASRKINRQFDVVTKDKNGYTAYECKYSDTPISKRVIDEEEQQTQGLDLEFYRLGFIAKAGFARGIDTNNHLLLTLEDLYN